MKPTHERNIIIIAIIVGVLVFVGVFLGHREYKAIQAHNAQAAALRASQDAEAAEEDQAHQLTQAYNNGVAAGKAQQAAADKTTVKTTTPTVTTKPTE